MRSCFVHRRAFRILALGLALSGLHSRGGAQTPSDRKEDLATFLGAVRALRPGAQGTSVQGRTARIGHLELEIERGSVFRLETPRGETFGLYFEGQGRYTYRTEDPADRLVIEANVSRHTLAPIYRNFTVSDRLERAVVFFAAPALQGLWETSGTDGEVSGGPRPPGSELPLSPDARSRFDTLWRDLLATDLEYDHLAAEARFNGGERQYVYAELDGERKRVGYSYDRVEAFEESLFGFQKIKGFDLRVRETLSQQNLERGSEESPAMMRLKAARIHVQTSDNRSGTITSDLDLEVGTDGLRAFHLYLVNNRDGRSFNWSSPKNRLEVRKITDQDGTPVPFSHRYHQLLLLVPHPLDRGDTLRLHVETGGEVFTGLGGELHDNYFELFDVPWFPEPGHWDAGGFTFNLKVRTRKPYLPIASGTTKKLVEAGDSYELETASALPSRMIAVFAGKYTTREEKIGNRTVRVYAYGQARKLVQDRMPRIADAFLSFYEGNLGPYPFEELNIVEVPKFGFGIAPSGMVLITSEAYNPYGFASTAREYQEFFQALAPGERTANISRGINARLAHEVAHQWFPHRAMPASPRDGWLSESIAEYLAGLAMAVANPDPRDAQGFPAMLANWRFFATQCKDAGPIEAAAMQSGEAAWSNRYCLLYNRGPLVLHMLRTMAGNEGFFAILRRFLDKAGSGFVTTEDFRKAAEEVLQTDLGWFFDQWYRRGGIPEIRIEQRVEATEAGHYFLVGRAVQAEGAEFKKMIIPFVLEFPSGRKDARLLFQDKPVTEFQFDLQGKPKKVTVDPAQNNLVVYR